MKIYQEDLVANVLKCVESFSISSVKVNGMADFRVSHGKLEPLTLNNKLEFLESILLTADLMLWS